MQPLTKPQKETLKFIIDFIQKKDYAPSIFDVKKKFKLRSNCSAFERINWLVEKKYLKKTKNTARGLEVKNTEAEVMLFIKNFNPRIFNHPKRYKNLIKILNEFKDQLN